MSALFVFIIFRHLKYRADAKANLFKEIYLAQEKERSRIAMDLHDDLGSSLLCIKMKLDEIKYHKESTNDIIQELEELIILTSDAIVKNRATSHLLMPESLRRYGLESSFKDLLKHYDRLFNFTFNCDLSVRLPFLIEINVYRIVSELLSNSAKHSKATEIKLCVSIEGTNLTLRYSDNGKGFEKGVIERLAKDFPEEAPFLKDLNSRMVDLLDVFKNAWYYDPQFGKSASIKDVLPVLVPALSYKSLAINNGELANKTYLSMIDGSFIGDVD
jgi:signal transduction histidine kinase